MSADPIRDALDKLESRTLEGPDTSSDAVRALLRSAVDPAPDPQPDRLTSGDVALKRAASRGPSRAYLDPRKAIDAARARNRL